MGAILHIADVGLAAIGVETEGALDGRDTAPEGATEAPEASPATGRSRAATASAPKARKPREDTEQAQHNAMLGTPEGTILARL
jgi:hypothetical protein